MIYLSDIKEFWKLDTDGIIDYLIDKEALVLINDFVDPMVKYNIDDLEVIWANTRKHYSKIYG
jgi:hypothetical protein